VTSVLKGAPVVINAGDGNDNVSVGNMDGLADGLTVKGELGSDTLTVNDFGATTDRNYVINTKKVSQGAATITLDSLDGLTINADNHSKVNTFDVQSATAAIPLTLNGGIGTDTVTISDSTFTKGQTYAFDAGKLTRTQPVGGKLALLTMQLTHSGVEKMVV